METFLESSNLSLTPFFILFFFALMGELTETFL